MVCNLFADLMADWISINFRRTTYSSARRVDQEALKQNPMPSEVVLIVNNFSDLSLVMFRLLIRLQIGCVDLKFLQSQYRVL